MTLVMSIMAQELPPLLTCLLFVHLCFSVMILIEEQIAPQPPAPHPLFSDVMFNIIVLKSLHI